MNLLMNLYLTFPKKTFLIELANLITLKLKYMKTKVVIAGQPKKKKTPSKPEKHLFSTDIIIKRISLFI